MIEYTIIKTASRKLAGNATVYFNECKLGTATEVSINEVLREANIKIYPQSNCGRRF